MSEKRKAIYIGEGIFYKLKLSSVQHKATLKAFVEEIIEEGLKQREDIKKYQNNMAKAAGSEVI